MAKEKLEVVQIATYTEDHLEFQISQLEQVIKARYDEAAAHEPIFQKAEEDFKLSQEIYDEARTKRETIYADIEKKKSWLEALVINRGANATKLNVKIIRPTSHADDKGKNKNSYPDTRINWIEPARKVLEREKRFMSTEELFQLVIQENEELANKYLERKTAFKYPVLRNWLLTAEKSKSRSHGKPVLAAYRHFIGLHTWMREDNTPLPRFIKGVLFQGDKLVDKGGRVVHNAEEIGLAAAV